ncbi:MAG: hypothetical protein HN849_09335 [Victivallales bacterium]|nr:hypothetical protein [Victivallales bacterium]
MGRIKRSVHCGLLGVAWAAFCSLSQAGDGIVDIADRNQVFIDGRYVQASRGVRVVVCPPLKTNEVCLRKVPSAYSSLIKPDGVFRYYQALTKDGVHWRRVSGYALPEPDDILGMLFGGRTVFVDPKAPADERYKMYDGMKNRIQASSDGSDWRVLHENVFPAKACYPNGMDSHNVCFYDAALGQYTAYVRVNKVYECPPGKVPYFEKIGRQRYGAPNRYARRAIGRAVTNDLSRFPMPEVVLAPDERDPTFDGVKVMDFYMPQVVRYPLAQDAYFLLNCRYRSYEDWYLPDDMSIYPTTTVGIYNIGVEDMELDASRDGTKWQRYDRKPWIRLGKDGSFDSRTMYMTRGMHVQGDEIWLYYVGLDDPHTGNREAQKRMILSRVVLRRDGFTCVEADYDGGEFTTPAVQFKGKGLFLNLDTSGMGLMRVELQDADGKPIPGFTMDDCDRIHTANVTSRRVTWRGKEDLAGLSSQAVKLHFELQFGTRLYSFRFGDK